MVRIEPIVVAQIRTLAEFTKTTLISGILIILPIYAVLLLGKAVEGLLEMLAPVMAQLPAGVEFWHAAAILLLVRRARAPLLTYLLGELSDLAHQRIAVGE